MNPINASVVIPTHRFDPSNMRRLILTIDLFLNQGFEVVVSDNSGFIKKHQQLVAEFGDNVVFAETVADCKAMDNFLAGFAAASGDYVLFASDDDTFFPTGIQVLATACSNFKDYIGFCAPTVRYAIEGTTIAPIPDLSSDDPIERLRQWVACDIAVSFYGCYHQAVWRRYFNFAKQHPVKFAHHDQLLRFIVADMGSIACLSSAWFAYDYSNWSNAHTAQASLIHYYTKAGFDERMIYVHPVLEGLEGALMQINLDALAGREFQFDAIVFWWNAWLNQFKESIVNYKNTMPEAVWSKLEPLDTYLNSSNDANVYQVLQLLSDFITAMYGSDAGLQQFWLQDAANSLRLS